MNKEYFEFEFKNYPANIENRNFLYKKYSNSSDDIQTYFIYNFFLYITSHYKENVVPLIKKNKILGLLTKIIEF